MDNENDMATGVDWGSRSAMLDRLLIDQPGDSVFQVHPAVYADQHVFELELEHIFAKSWIYLGHESQLHETGRFFTTHIGATPILVTRGKGRLNGFVNMCRHKGSLLCSQEEGKRSVFVCPYHQWSYAADGRLLGLKDKEHGHYPAGFFDQDLDLLPIARIDSYSGFIFGALSATVPTLDEFLGDMRVFIDAAMDQAPDGMEIIPGRTPYSFEGNWKLQLDNGLDPYHVTSAHASLVAMQAKRAGRQAAATVRGLDWQKRAVVSHHAFNFSYGHAAYVIEASEPEKHPAFGRLDQLRARIGEKRAQASLSGYQLQIFPNLQIATSAATIVRRFHPTAVGRTEMDVRCLGAKGESPHERALRIRQFEDFFGVSGLASPDDTVIYEGCQMTLNSNIRPLLHGFSRGLTLTTNSANAMAEHFGVKPEQSLTGPALVATELNMHAPYREWRRLIAAGLENRPAYV